MNCKWAGGACLSIVAELIGVCMDTKKDEDESTSMGLLGSRVGVLPVEAKIVLCVEETKAEKWTADLEKVIATQHLAEWKAAKYAGRLNFTLALNLNRVGRAYLRPFHAQSNAPLHGGQLSTLAARACQWFIAYFHSRPCTVIRTFAPPRTHLVTWSDAAGKNRKVAAFLWSRNGG